ncbi:Sporulation related domain-containing protein [Mariprofundus aestuarium]|uniref:Sporulation related domain-containing protein n=1 Tax=Mariprofundus aestuarium TaxID=1921086 RepID=A0A2K8KWQ5_MARES|nr:SPOR domain-containing protein [Mariprofundus aestuarium]ATX79307.1 Sporulation related domain-containing protein [Mariprofundus aestuarium]
MSESNSGMDIKKQSFEQVDDDPASYLDSLIAQFEDDSNAHFANEIDQLQSTADGEIGLIKQAVLEPEKSSSQNPPLDKAGDLGKSLLVGMVVVAVLGVGLWLAFRGDDKAQTIIATGQPVTTATEHAAAQPVPPQPAAIPVVKEPITTQLKTVVPEPSEPPLSAAEQQAEVKTEAAADSDTIQHPGADLASRKVTAPKSGQSGKVWAVNLTSVSTLASAGEIEEDLNSRGVTTEVKRVTVGGKLFYRIRIPGFGSREEAEQVRLPFLKEREFSSAWVEDYRVEVLPSE